MSAAHVMVGCIITQRCKLECSKIGCMRSFLIPHPFLWCSGCSVNKVVPCTSSVLTSMVLSSGTLAWEAFVNAAQ